ncbi:Trans-1,2-dihydrobenzene-1,2-diol dehydrogenase [Acipenser ruthenus]|uniref:Trans-1,2-dihydrobenzene-1,2-diol dehydrogenase n=1 Tax=Acipenser ruthenus TaxID=7906 RepID=A0A444V1H1_ACIRT|nr:Trans-1,2-dihydrobenzene-1,2-diol dehydrogenase [Acipenser ruthenus]
MATRWGICSAGKISHDFVVALKTLPREEHQVVAVAARELGWAQDFANRHDIPRAYGSYQELAQDKDIERALWGERSRQALFSVADVVYLGTIHPQHHPVGLLFLRAKKNLLCEKPLAMNMREVLELTAAARENDVFLMEALWTRYFPASIQISDVLAQGVLGEVKLVRVEFGMPMLDVSRAVKKELGGVDEAMTVVLRFSSNRMAVCICTISVQLPNEAFIFGTKGTIKVKIDGLKQSPRMMLEDTALLTSIRDEARRQVGVVYCQDAE